MLAVLTLDFLQQHDIGVGFDQRIANWVQGELAVACVKTLVQVVGQDAKLVFRHVENSPVVALRVSLLILTYYGGQMTKFQVQANLNQ